MARNRQRQTEETVGQSMTHRTAILMFLCGIVAFIVLIAQLAHIMIGQHDRYESAAVEDQVRSTTVNASRGTIYDTNMLILAQSATVETVYVSPYEMVHYGEDKEAIAAALARILDVDYDGIMAKWEDTESWYKTVRVKVEQDLADEVRAYVNGGFMDDPNYRDPEKTAAKRGYLVSVHLIEDTKRYYPYSSLGSQIIGFVGTDNFGLDGIEAVYNDTLEGENGRIVRTAAANGTDMLFTGYEEYHDAKDGNSIALTLDATVQYYLKKNLEQAIEDNEIRSGGIGIVMDVKTGAILGMLSVPDYDLNNFGTLNESLQAKLDAWYDPETMTAEDYNARYLALLQQQWRNRAIGDTYEPGSTFKIITLASALEDGAVTVDDHFNCGGAMQVLGRKEPLHCWRRSGHGDQTLAQSAQNSCNVAFATIGLRLGAKRFYDYMEAFGFFDRTGIDLYGESSSIWWSRRIFEDPYNHSQLAAASFGQTFNITPIQLITAVSAAVNGGHLMKPYVVKQVIAEDGTVVSNTSPTEVRQVISEETSRIVCDIIETVVSSPSGTGKNASVAGYRVGGKTGTSEKVGQASDEYMVSFIGVAPMDDPQVAVLVILDSPDPTSGIYISGGGMVAPTVGNILADILPYLGVEESGGSTSSNVTVPNVRSASVDDAVAQMESLGFGVKVVGYGDTVTDQAPVGNLKITAGSTVILYAGAEKPRDQVTVPDMNGKTYKAAKQYFDALGLYIKTAGVAPSEEKAKYIVVQRQSVSAGESVSFGTVVEIGLIDNDTSIMETHG
ncbi:MAG: PASTA domain-containing protein [Oscillospiraceae bacterium]|nr:PASTA domain-containing protein [Oscillospiraceae bacterium]MBR4691481.1 PASTA domain-containing protein [Oscillospiraceae bacterium]